MHSVWTDDQGRTYRAGPLLGKGGEGAVYECQSDPSLVLKIYHQIPTGEHPQKLAGMVALCSAELERVAAWPKATLRSAAGKPIAGVAMPRLRGLEEIHELYNPRSRSVRFPKAGWRFLVAAAANLARAVQLLHERGIVVGDVNQKNVMVGTDATIRLVDCDSYQVSHGGKTFLCRVGVPEFTPPELQGRPLGAQRRTPDHDAFGLAVLIFHLLFLGRHPFAGRYLGAGEMPLERAIGEGRFAYSSQSQSYDMAPPPHTPTLGFVTSEVARCFEEAFQRPAGGTPKRPAAKEWVLALAAMEREFVRCRRDERHEYPRVLTACPWCVLEGRSPTAAPFPSARGPAVEQNAEALWRTIAAMPPPATGVTVPRPSPGQFMPAPLPLHCVRHTEAAGLAPLLASLAGASAALLLPGVFVEVLYLLSPLLFTVFGGWWFWLSWSSPIQRELHERQVDLVRARKEAMAGVAALSGERQTVADRFEQRRRSAENCFRARDTADREQDAAISEARLRLRGAAREAYLRSQPLFHASLPGIGPARRDTLAAYGIVTAADIDPSRLAAIPGFGPALCATLEGWRIGLERQFEAAFTQPADTPEIRRLQETALARKRKIDQDLVVHYRDLLTLHGESERLASEVEGRLQPLVDQVAQCEVDLRFCESHRTKWLPGQNTIAAIAAGYVLLFALATGWRGVRRANQNPAAAMMSRPSAWNRSVRSGEPR